jgi:hypothetical protein
MSIIRYTASADTTITNAFDATLSTRGSGSNMGYADSMEIFSIYGQTSSSADGQSQELSRALVQFPVASITADRTAGTIPASGSVSFYLKMFNAVHPFTLPQGFTLVAAPISRSWSEGTGLDMDEYRDLGTANWIKSDDNTSWSAVGGDYRSVYNYNTIFALGYEDLEIDISGLVEDWILGTYPNYGIGLRLTASQEAYFSSSTGLDSGSVIQNVNGATESYYTKKFFARSTEFFFKRPMIEARWDSRVKDDRGNFYYSSSLATATDNMNTIYLYNYIRGKLTDVPALGTGPVMVSFYSGTTAPTASALVLWDGTTAVTGGWVDTGIYSASVALTAAAAPLELIYDVWHSSSVEYFTGSFVPEVFPTFNSAPTFNKITKITNLKKIYSRKETGRFRLFVRDRDWSPTIYTIATATNPTDIIVSGAYSVARVIDDLEVISYGTGSDMHTYMSYDNDGNYFDLDMSLLEAGYMYKVKLTFYNDSISSWIEQPYEFKFRLEE